MNSNDYDELLVHGIDFSHSRLVDLTRLADQAQPFYQWIEKKFQIVAHSSKPLDELVFLMEHQELVACIETCYMSYEEPSVPKLFDGGGLPYKHRDACFFFFAWMVRDAAVQRLRPLITRARKVASVSSQQIEIEVLARLLKRYRSHLKFFSWPVVREVTIQRLEGSRRAKKGSNLEVYTRLALSHSFSYYYQTRGNYGKYLDYEIVSKPVKVGKRTYDVAAWLNMPDDTRHLLIIPVKSRETEGGGHSHLFTRDIEQANLEIRRVYPNAIIGLVIVAQNWSVAEVHDLRHAYAGVFHFNSNPNMFSGFTDTEQIEMNKMIERVLSS